MMAFLAAFFIATLSLSGVLIFGRKGHMTGTHRFIVPFTIGAFLVIVFMELIPETLESSLLYGPYAILGGYLLFYFLSNALHTYHHHHDEQCQVEEHCHTSKATASLLLWGDAVHNITDGVVIASAFLVNPVVGVMTTIGIALHEIPQEIAEFGVLRKAGYSTTKAAILNFISALSILIGVGVSLFFVEVFNGYLWILTGLAAGNLLYIATSDLLPGVHIQAKKSGTFFSAFFATLAGVCTILLIMSIESIFL